MKKIIYLFSVLSVIGLTNCSPDSDPPTPTPNPTIPPTGGGTGGGTTSNFNAIQGLWDYNYSISSSSPAQVSFYVGNGSKVEFTNIPYVVNGYTVPDNYVSNGGLFNNNYPTSGQYSYNSSTNSINNCNIFSVDANDMVISYYGSGTSYFSKQTWIPTTYSWELSFDVIPTFSNIYYASITVSASNATGGGSILTNGQFTQNTYSGSGTFNSSNTSPSVSISTIVSSGGQLSNNVNVNLKFYADGVKMVDETYQFNAGTQVTNFIPSLNGIIISNQ